MKKVRFSLPTRWRNFLNVLATRRTSSPDRLMSRIERCNKRLAMSEARG